MNASTLLEKISTYLIVEGAKAKIKPRLEALGYYNIRLVQDEKWKAFLVVLAEGDDHILFLCRGTASIRQGVSNGSYQQRKYRYVKGRIHAGFGKEVEDTSFEVANALGHFKYSGKPVRFIGHSRGAATGLLHSYLAYHNQGLEIESAYCFGSPRIGSKKLQKKLAAAFGSKIHQISLRDDLVSQVPPTRIMSLYFPLIMPRWASLVLSTLVFQARYAYNPGHHWIIEKDRVYELKTYRELDRFQRDFYRRTLERISPVNLISILKEGASLPRRHLSGIYKNVLAEILEQQSEKFDPSSTCVISTGSINDQQRRIK